VCALNYWLGRAYCQSGVMWIFGRCRTATAFAASSAPAASVAACSAAFTARPSPLRPSFPQSESLLLSLCGGLYGSGPRAEPWDAAHGH
jgi:hypothetical protein